MALLSAYVCVSVLSRGIQPWPTSLGEFTEVHAFSPNPDNISSWESDEGPYLLPQDQENKEKYGYSWRGVSSGCCSNEVKAKASPGRGCGILDLLCENEGSKSSS